MDLLTLQAVLYELYWYGRNQSQDGEIVVDQSTFAGYVDKRTEDVVVGGALERWVDRALDQSSTAWPGDSSEIAPSMSDGAVKRIAARLPRYLSSGGFKTAANSQDLLRSCLREDLARLWPGWDRHTLPDEWPWDIVAESGFQRNLSGIAFMGGLVAETKPWAARDVGDSLVQLYNEVLERLRRANIIKVIDILGKDVVELVHDRLGKPFIQWADLREGVWDDFLYAFTSSLGEDIRIDGTKTGLVQGMCWRGCWISPSVDACLDHVIFDNCDLSGTIFYNCRFVGGGFRNCKLHGAIFRDCTFENGKGPVRFEDIATQGLSFLTTGDDPSLSWIQGLEFREARLRGLVMSDITLDGPVRFSGTSSVFQARFTNITTGNSKDACLHFEEGCRLTNCAWDSISGRVMKVDDAPSQFTTINRIPDGFEY